MEWSTDLGGVEYRVVDSMTLILCFEGIFVEISGTGDNEEKYTGDETYLNK